MCIRDSDSDAVMGANQGIKLGMPREEAEKVSGDNVIVGIRPEGWEVVSAVEPPEGTAVELEVVIVEQLGVEQYAYCTPVDGVGAGIHVRGQNIAVRVDKRITIQQGERIWVRPIAGEPIFFEPETEINYSYLD